MLENLHIENIAIIDNTDLSFSDGFQVLTGQTGAGKSIIIDSINLLTGERSSRELVRSGAEKGFVEGAVYTTDKTVFDILEEAGISCEEGEPIILSREISKDGRSVVRINSRITTTGILKSVCRRIINIHGQNDNQAILDVNYHGEFLDSFSKNGDILSRYQSEYLEYKNVLKELNEAETDDSLKEQKKEMLIYQIEEIENANLTVGEYEELVEKRNKFLNSEKINVKINEAFSSLFGDEENVGALNLVGVSSESLCALKDLIQEADELSSRLNDVYYSLEDIVEEIRYIKDNDDSEGIDINTVEERIDLLNRLKSKYKCEIEEIIKKKDEFSEELLKITDGESYKEKLKLKLEELKNKVEKTAGELSENRKSNARKLEKLVLEQLKDLEMENVLFKVSIEEGELSAKGKDKIEFLICANKGEELKPLNKVASGGELSRIILALKVILSKSDCVSTMVFDEVDTGVSGSAAQKIAEKIKAISKEKQVFVITHLPQIAAFGDSHYLIEKEVLGEKTFSRVHLLNKEERVSEIARLLSGSVITKSAESTARELMAFGGEY